MDRESITSGERYLSPVLQLHIRASSFPFVPTMEIVLFKRLHLIACISNWASLASSDSVKLGKKKQNKTKQKQTTKIAYCKRRHGNPEEQKEKQLNGPLCAQIRIFAFYSTKIWYEIHWNLVRKRFEWTTGEVLKFSLFRVSFFFS